MRHNRLHLSLSHKEKQTLGVEVRWTSVMISQPGQTSVLRNPPQREAGPQASACSDAAKHKTREASNSA